MLMNSVMIGVVHTVWAVQYMLMSSVMIGVVHSVWVGHMFHEHLL